MAICPCISNIILIKLYVDFEHFFKMPTIFWWVNVFHVTKLLSNYMINYLYCLRNTKMKKDTDSDKESFNIGRIKNKSSIDNGFNFSR